GKMFHPMAATVLYALIAAFILSVTFIPAMIGLLMTLPSDGEREGDTPMMRRLKDLYARTLELSLSRPFIITGAASALFLSSLFLFTQLGQEFVPTLDEIDIALQAMRIPSTSLTQSTEMQRDVERTLIQLPEVAYVFSKTGTAEMASDPMPPNLSDTFVILKPCQQWENPKLTKEELIEKMEEALSVLTGNGFEFTQPIEMRFNELISGVRTDVAIKVYGDAFDKMQQTAEKIFSIVEGIPGAADVKMAQTEGLPVLHIEIDRAVASTLGLNAADILDVIAIATGGGHAGVIFEGDRRFELLVRMPETERNDLNALNRLPIPLKTGKGKISTIPLQEVAKLHISEGLNEIQRENGKRFVSVMANVRGRDLLSFVKETQKAVTSQVKIPDGYWIEWGGEFEQWLSAKQRLEIVIPLCLIVILFLLYTALGTLREALIVFSGVPFALTGGILALWLRELPFSISSAVGFIALSGIAVLNGLVLMTATAQRFKLSNDYWRAVKEGAIVRLRPVLMTALVASLGFIPMALATGTGAEVQRPLATVVIGGLISSTALTLLVLPALCLIFIPKGARVRSPKNQIGERVLQ
ncbi:MAG: CusA/CzcA family heavy metal efflux RND transporter, partial [Chlamydiia bacterium]|nr:CusA/CzcA family heavy metal efflux RND transporter [Chlamydiia bacterium]